MKLVSLFRGIKKLGYNLLFAMILAAVFLGSDWLFSQYQSKYTFAFNFRRFFGFSLIIFFVSLCRKKIFIRGFFIVASLMVFSEMVHLNIYNSLIFPYTYYVSFVHLNEVVDATDEYLYFAIIPTIYLVVLLGVSWFVTYWLHDKKLKVRFFSLFIIFLFVFFPIHSYFTKDKFGTRADSHASLFYNSYSTLSYFVSHIIPRKMFTDDQALAPEAEILSPDIKRSNPDANVILVLGESLSSKYMSLYGYKKDTTPFLMSLSKEDPKFVHKKAISCGVSTNVSVPLYLNMDCSLNGIQTVISEKTCLFKMAKDNGFNTYLYSAQAGNSLKGILNYYCPKYIDDLQGAFEITGSTDYLTTLKDKELIKQLDSIDFDQSNFIVLQQQTSHAPYRNNYDKKYQVFNEAGEDFRERMKSDFLNSVLYTDSFIKDVFEYLKKRSDKKTYLMFFSDHGEAMGEGGRWGHLQLYPEQYEVPFFFYDFGGADSDLVNQIKNRNAYFTSNQLSQMTAFLLGYSDQFFKDENFTYVIGRDMEGLDGYLELTFEGEKITRSIRKVTE